MAWDEVVARCMAKPGAWEDQPWDGDTVVKVGIGRFGWNRLAVGGAIPDAELDDAVDQSYEAVLKALPKKDRPS